MPDKLIKSGDYVIVQRQGYLKLHKLKQHGVMSLGSFTIEMDNVVGCNYFDTFQMKIKQNAKKMYTLERVSEMTTVSQLDIETSGADNRNITDDGQSQNLTREQIEELKEAELSSNGIVSRLISNSKTFNSKTEYSQQKYLKKKEKKYFEYLQIKRPTLRLLAQLLHRQDPSRILGIRVDDLSQILTYANIHSEGNYLLYDSGTCGLISAAILNAMGANTKARLVHMHPGNECQKNAFLAMRFPEEQRQRCINVNLYSVLRHYYQHEVNVDGESACKKIKLDEPKKPWQLDNEKAHEILCGKVDAVIITAKEHPLNLVKEMVNFLKDGCTIVVFSILREPLQDVYLYLKSRIDFIFIRLTNNFMRTYQVLHERTHPNMNMNSGGFILSGFKVAV